MKLVRVFVAGIMLFIVWSSCSENEMKENPNDFKINLRWVKAYPLETKQDIEAGITWALSFLGATLPKGSLAEGIQWKNEQIFNLNLDKLGISDESHASWKAILDTLKNSEEYSLRGGIDLGRFVMLTLNSTNHYYALTGAKHRYVDFRSAYNFDEKKAGIILSTVAFGNRLIEISTATQFNEIAFVAAEGEGSLADDSFEPKEFEAMNFMANGQLRFALYDINGNLKLAASKSLTAAGKPAKCLWCHEISLLPPFDDDSHVQGYYSTDEFKSKIEERTQLVKAYRETLHAEIDFTKVQDHTKAELLYLSFMEPSAERLALEWGMSVNQVEVILSNVDTHAHHEFSFLGDKLYFRQDVEQFAPFDMIQLPDDARNASAYEPDFIH